MPEKDLTITSLAGGQNDTDSPSELAEDECVLAQNVEFFYSACGERRNGCGPLDLTGSGLTTESIIVHISQWFPTNDVLNPEYFVIAATPTVSIKAAVRTNGVWSPVTLIDTPDVSVPDVYSISVQSLNGKLFLSYHSAVDRLHVWDGTAVRRSGFATPVAPTGANEGAGAFVTVRYYRVRFITKVGAVITRRSEPGPILTFTPSGTGAGVTVTRPALLGEGETHWELEASVDNIAFYIIATTAVGTTTFNDEIPFSTGYALNGTLSETIGTNLPLYSAKFLAVEGDRLILGGHWTDQSKKSQVAWTPVLNDPGFGNDERLPSGTGAPNNTVVLDSYDGGPLTGLATGITGTWYATKWKRIYKFTRTGNVTKAYDNLTLSSTSGAIQGSIAKGADENGATCVYFLDPAMGPSRVGPSGPQVIVGLRTTWGTINLQAAAVVARSIYYANKQQVHWWIATSGGDRPNLELCLQVSEIQPKRVAGGNGVGRGWSIVTGRRAQAVCVAMLTEIVSINGISQVSDRPFIGLTSPDFVQRCDTESTDAGVAFTAIIRTRPYIAAGLLNKWGAMTAALLATSNVSTSLRISFIRDFNMERTTRTTSLAPTATEDQVVKIFDDLVMSGATTIQVEISDP
jgi:hypothetical protein